MACGNYRDLWRVLREFVAAPNYVQIGADEEEIGLIDFAGSLTGNVEYLKRGMHFSKRLLES